MNNVQQVKTYSQRKISDFLFILWAGGAALLSYSLVYALRKPYTAAGFDGLEAFGMDYKVVVTIAQILGYVLSKFIGIKLISELKRENRMKFILISIILAEASLILFGLLPAPYNIGTMFLNGLSLGCMWGIIFSFIEGRRMTDILASLLGVSMVISSGTAKSAGLYVMDTLNISEFWMPALIGGVALPLLALLGYALNRLPQPTAEDIAMKSKRETLNGKQRWELFKKAIEEFREGLIDVIVTAPINKHTIQSEGFAFPGHTEYIEQRLGNGSKSLMILMKEDFRVALVTGHIPVREIASSITKELIQEKLVIFNRSLKQDFGIGAPRIAVLALNPHAGDDGLLGTEEQEIISPAIQEMAAKGILCYGPYPADGFMGSGNFTHFDGVLAMYHDQGLAPFKALAMDEGVNYTAGLPVIRTSPAHGTAYDIAGKGVACEDSFRQAIYVAIDVFRNRQREKEAHANPLRKQYYEKRDDSDKLKLDTVDDDI